MEYFDYLNNLNGIELNNQQKNAVSFERGNALVLSTAGSGKTTVIIARAGRLFYEKICRQKILTITFSKMAASDMKNRFNSCFGEMYNRQAEFSTIHAFAYKIIRNFYNKKGIRLSLLTNNYQVLSEILKAHYSKSYFSYIGDEEIENLSSAISYINNMMLNPADYNEYGIEIKNFDLLYEEYRKYKVQKRLVDFDDMLIYAYKILSKSANMRNDIKNAYEFVQIDEMQDTSKIQHEIIKLITCDNLFMVGDDDQAIYSFRGSLPVFMLKFKDYYKNGNIFYLDNNYRSDKNIVEGAKKFIEGNKNRYKKSITTNNNKEREINILHVADRAEQAKYIINEISRISDGTVGILYRYNMSCMILINGLYENNINFYIKEDKTKFFNSFVLYDILAFLNLALNPKDKESFARIYYKSYTYFTKNMCQTVLNSPDDEMTVFEILYRRKDYDYYVYERIEQFRRDMKYLSKLSPKEAILFIKRDLEYKTYLERLQEEGRNNLANSLHILEILEEVGSYCSSINEFMTKVYSLKDLIKKASENFGADITLSTIHSAKGLEYDYVYMIDNIAGEFPLEEKNISSEEYADFLEEERRVFYVGMTRAKKELNIIAPGMPSVFINDLIQSNKKNNTAHYNVNMGQTIHHKKYGSGVVVDIRDNIVYIKFKYDKVKSFDLNILIENKIIEISDSY